MSITPRSPVRISAGRRSPVGRNAAAMAPIALLLLGGLLGGCASGGAGVKNPLRGPSQARFMTLVKQNCGGELVGGQPISSLLASDTTFRQLTARLYRGDISNDELVNLLLQQYPADDANIPATGCVVDQLSRCLSGNCDARPVESPDEIAAQAMVAERDAGIEELRPADRTAVETMIDNVDSTPVEPMEPLPSQDPSVIAPGTATETATEIKEPGKP